MSKAVGWYMVGGLLIIIMVAVAITRFGFGGNEDVWLCQNGQWVAHGRPQNPPPKIPCTLNVSPSSVSVVPDQNDLVILYYQPRQCQQMSWDEWYASGGATFNPKLRPSYEDIIVAYYAQQGIKIMSVERVESDKMVCEACDICPTSYSLKITAPSDQVGKLSLVGWMSNESDQQPIRRKIIIP